MSLKSVIPVGWALPTVVSLATVGNAHPTRMPVPWPLAMKRALQAIVRREEGGYVAHCPEYDIASQGSKVEEARANLVEALELFLECASPEELARRRGGTAGDSSIGLPLRIFDPLGEASD